MQYPWKRYWLERGGSISFLDQGFVYDPAAEGGKNVNPGLAPLSIEPEISCTILLGEPGTGKSSELDLLSSRVPSLDTTLALNLRSFGDETRFVNAVFENRQIRKWKAGKGTLHLFLDSLDECLLRIDTAATIIVDELAQLSSMTDRLRFYIACRTAPWPAFLETKLIDQFGEGRVRVLEIAPLLKADVRAAAELEGISRPDDFVREIIISGAVALAMKPVTLKFLISSWQQSGSFPTNLVDLYREGCRRLCEEDNPTRRASQRLGADSRRRFEIATRIAALTQIGNRFAIWTGRPSERVPDEDVPLHELATEEVDETTLRDTLDTGLFSARGRERIGWAHQTYAEFLAGSYCNTQGLSLSQLRTLFFHPSGTGLVPQLTDVAGWAALGNPELLREIAREDPESLLNAGLDCITDAQKQSIVDGLLGQCQRGKYLHFNWSRAAVYSRLKHPALLEQLRDALSQRDSNIQMRYMAISLGQSCKEAELCKEAVQIALDDTEDLGLRHLCAVTISDLGSFDERKDLQPLLTRAGSGSQLKAYVLEALWPSVISSEEVFSMLLDWDGHFEALSSFLHGPFRLGLGRTDLKPALHWAQKCEGTEGPQASLINDILQLGWEHIDDGEVCALLAQTVASKLGVYGWFATSIHGNDFQKLIDSDDKRRRILVRALLSRLQGEDFAVLHYPLRIANPNDVPWFLNEFGSFDQDEQSVAIKFLRLTLDRSLTEQMTVLWNSCQSWPALAENFGFYFRPVPLDGDEAKFERESMGRRAQKGSVLDPTPTERVLNALTRSEQGEVDAWVLVVQELTLKEGTLSYGNYHEASILTMPGWLASDASTRQRIVEAANRYLESSPFFDLVWPTEGTVPLGAFAVAQALWICVQMDASYIENKPEIAEKCVQSIVRFHVSSKGSTSVKQELLRQLVKDHEAAVRKVLLGEIRGDNERHGYYLAGDSVAAAWHPALGRELVGLLRGGGLKAPTTVSLLVHIFQLSPELAREFASSSLLLHPVDQPYDEIERAVALAWMKGDPHTAWDHVWPLMQKDINFGDYMIGQLGGALLDQPRFLSVVDVTALADFFIWMVKRFPYPEPEEESFGPRPVVVQHYLRDTALEHLKQRGTFAAVDEISRIIDVLPDYGWLRVHLDQADLIARASTWEPFSINELQSVLADTNRRLVGSERDLLEILCESIQRLQHQLRGEIPTVRFLWNTGTAITPKGEEDLSDFMAAHFRTDIGNRGVIVNREVQIRRLNPGGVPGQRTDVHVSATSSGGSAVRTVSVIIEVKACWNPEVLVAMKTQLRDRYLRDNAIRTGLYVVGWYASPVWDTSDSRRQRCGILRLDDLRLELEQQANDLSAPVLLKSLVVDCSLE